MLRKLNDELLQLLALIYSEMSFRNEAMFEYSPKIIEISLRFDQ